jgi:hypothetical protein
MRCKARHHGMYTVEICNVMPHQLTHSLLFYFPKQTHDTELVRPVDPFNYSVCIITAVTYKESKTYYFESELKQTIPILIS